MRDCVLGVGGVPARTEGRRWVQVSERQRGSPSAARLRRQVTTRRGRGAFGPKALPAAPGKVVLTFPKAGLPNGRGFQTCPARALGWEGAGGVASMGWGWGQGIFSGYPQPHPCQWLGRRAGSHKPLS